MTDARLAAAIAEEAGKRLVTIQRDGDPDAGARGDAEANRLILDRLREARPDDAVLSEESADDLTRLDARRVWIIDPLDGTREFGEGRDDWAVHVALAIDGAPLVGAVALPARGIVLASDAPPALPAPATPPRMLVSRSRPSQLCANVRDAIGAETIGMGSAGAKAMAVVLGEAEIYLHSGGQHQWDNCAPAAVALAAGLHASRIDGSPLVYNARSTGVPDLLICRTEWADRVLAAVGNCGG
ncbi:3'(2'),5'-bisphosphate nucleotidase CysQ [Sphingomonas aestuarii]